MCVPSSLHFFSSSEINHSRTTEFCYESGAVKVSHSFASVLLLIKGNISSL